MRSRDGSHSFSLRLCTIIFLFSLALSADEYFISYRYVVKDALLFNETLHISPAMQKCQGVPQTPLILETRGEKKLKKIISLHREDFIEYIHKLGLQVQHNSKTYNAQNSSTTTLTLRTLCFKVDFNDNFVKIAPLK